VGRLRLVRFMSVAHPEKRSNAVAAALAEAAKAVILGGGVDSDRRTAARYISMRLRLRSRKECARSPFVCLPEHTGSAIRRCGESDREEILGKLRFQQAEGPSRRDRAPRSAVEAWRCLGG
jgi:hypothetical protein